MNLKQKMFLNTVGTVVLLFAQWLISVLIVRMGGYDDAGTFSLAMSVSNIFAFLANYGIRNYQVADSRNRFTQQQYLWARLITCTLSFLTASIYLTFGRYTAEEKGAIFMYLVYSNVNVISDTMQGTLQVHNKLECSGYSNMMRGVCCFIGFIGVYALSTNLIASLTAMVFSSLGVTMAYDLPRYFNYEKLRGKWIAGKEGQILKDCFPLMIANVLPIVITAFPRILINQKLGSTELGYFSSIFTPTVLITTLVPTAVLSVIPRMAEFWSKGERKLFGQLCVALYIGTIFCGVVALLGAALCGKTILVLLFGQEIAPYSPLLCVAIATTVLNAFISCGNAVLLVMGERKTIMKAALIGLVVILLLTNALIDTYAVYGAAYALIFAYGVEVLWQFKGIVLQRKNIIRE